MGKPLVVFVLFDEGETALRPAEGQIAFRFEHRAQKRCSLRSEYRRFPDEERSIGTALEWLSIRGEVFAQVVTPFIGYRVPAHCPMLEVDRDELRRCADLDGLSDVGSGEAVVLPVDLDKLVGMHLRPAPASGDEWFCGKGLQPWLFCLFEGDPRRYARRPMTTLPIVVEAPSQGVLVQLIEARVRIARIEQAIKFAGYLDKALDFSLVLGSAGRAGSGITP